MKAKQITSFLLSLFLTTTATDVCAQDSSGSLKKGNENGITDSLKSFWKTNELIIGISVVVMLVLIIFLIWRRRKKSIDSVL
ncbi:MAG TPA: hypothetical protein PLA68_00085 [Panacibacter sp.]|nr:hypothetical protein [Panacibacter sp.]